MHIQGETGFAGDCLRGSRFVPPATYKVGKAGQREPAPLAHLDLPDDLLDEEDPEQAALDAGEGTDSFGIWRGHQPGT